jgi:hypothetical protein
LVELWLTGSKVADPTVGDGAFIRALISQTISEGHEIREDMLENLFGFDIRPDGIEELVGNIKLQFGISLKRGNFHVLDSIFGDFPHRFDILFGNPPWVNFANLPFDYKEQLKPKFKEFGLVSNTHSTLLGNSRVDIAALVVNRLVSDALAAKGQILMFLPYSLFIGTAHEPFRRHIAKEKKYFLNQIVNFGNQGIFGNQKLHGTSFVFAKFSFEKNDHDSSTYFRFEGDEINGVLSTEDSKGEATVNSTLTLGVQVPATSRPRQGINTCGANNIFFGDIIKGSISDKKVLFRNLLGLEFEIESALIYPLLMRENLKFGAVVPSRYVILPYSIDTNRLLTPFEMGKFKYAQRYFASQKHLLEARRGVLIQSAMKKGSFWALMGVGPYAFSETKLVWLTAGQSTFEPRIFTTFHSKPWQANQSLQAFMPFESYDSAERCKLKFESLFETVDLEMLGQPKSLSWAQPGRVSRYLILQSD